MTRFSAAATFGGALLLGCAEVALSGCRAERATGAGASPAASAAPAPRVIEIAAGDRGFTPSTVTVRRGEPVILRFTRQTESGCTSEVVFPDLGVKRELPMNASVDVPLTPSEEGNILFECGMAMLRGRVVVAGD